MTQAVPPPDVPDMGALLSELQQMLLDKQLPVTSRWVCYQHGVGAGAAQKALQACVDQAPQDVAVTYLLSGVSVAPECQRWKLMTMRLPDSRFGGCR